MVDTIELEESPKPDGPLYGIQTANDSRIAVFGGGFPLRVDGTIVGTVGSSGGQVDEDETVARAVVDRFEELTS